VKTLIALVCGILVFSACDNRRENIEKLEKQLICVWDSKHELCICYIGSNSVTGQYAKVMIAPDRVCKVEE
jgi:hypothetical protein